MSYRVIVEPIAKQDIRQAKQWLADQKEGLEVNFRDDLDQVIDRISSNPNAYATVQNEIRQTKLKNCPYVVSYLIYQDRGLTLCPTTHSGCWVSCRTTNDQ